MREVGANLKIFVFHPLILLINIWNKVTTNLWGTFVWFHKDDNHAP